MTTAGEQNALLLFCAQKAFVKRFVIIVDILTGLLYNI